MADQITISKTLSIRDCGYDENWLQEQIAANPSILGLGDLDLVHREKQQSSGGRLDFLLEDSANGSMFEVELMLGATDESHIIRTIEYWELERHRWPKRSHTAVLAAEKINRRFFNVISLISHSIPVIAVQANLIEAEGKRLLHFTTILDAYQEPELEEVTSPVNVDENYWQKKASWTLTHAKTLQEIFSHVLGKMTLQFTKKHILLSDERDSFCLLGKRSNVKSSFSIWLNKAETPAAKAALDNKHHDYEVKRPEDSGWQEIRLSVDQDFIQENENLFQEFAKFYQWSCQRTGEN